MEKPLTVSKSKNEKPLIIPEWKMPEPPDIKCSCGKPLNNPVCYNDLDELLLCWDCEDLCGDTGEYEIPWPFTDEYGDLDKLVELGFTLDLQ